MPRLLAVSLPTPRHPAARRQPTESYTARPFGPASRQQEGQRRSRPTKHGAGCAGRQGSVRHDILCQRRQLRHRVRSKARAPSTAAEPKYAVAPSVHSALLASSRCSLCPIPMALRCPAVASVRPTDEAHMLCQVRHNEGAVAMRRACAVHQPQPEAGTAGCGASPA